MHRLRSWYYDNKEKFWGAIIIALLVIFFIQVINNYYKDKSSSTTTNVSSSSSTTLNTINNEISGKLESTASAVSGSTVSSSSLEEATSVIDDFFVYCNNGQVEEAYNLLTDECKEELYSTLEKFTNYYYNVVFDTYKEYTVQNWTGNTYKIKIMEDALTTGNASEGTLQAYYTIVEKDDEIKLNINGYIGRTSINKTKTVDGITITVVSKDTYMEYETYDIEVTNMSGNTIMLDSGNSTSTIYLLDSNDNKEYAASGEILYSTLKMQNGVTKSYTFKFSNSYSTTRTMKYIVFDNVITNYDEYTENEEEYDGYESITVNI